MKSFSKILLPVDFTECSVATLPYATMMAEKFSAEIYLLYTLAGSEQYKGLDFESDWNSQYGVVLKREAERAMENFIDQHLNGYKSVRGAIRIGEVVEEIVKYADERDIDLIITASHDCHNAEKRIYGSVAESVSREAGCPVMIIHP